MAKRTALVTGITGQDGSYLAEFLLEKGYTVVGMVRRTSTINFDRIRHIQDHVDLVQGDLLDQMSLADDETLSRGSCRIESGRRTLITDVETRLEQIHRTWMENLDATQVERRGDGTGGRTLRRFPERRETA